MDSDRPVPQQYLLPLQAVDISDYGTDDSPHPTDVARHGRAGLESVCPDYLVHGVGAGAVVAVALSCLLYGMANEKAQHRFLCWAFLFFCRAGNVPQSSRLRKPQPRRLGYICPESLLYTVNQKSLSYQSKSAIL
jgi:hypothetical protein